jgi:hypothetical protein
MQSSQTGTCSFFALIWSMYAEDYNGFENAQRAHYNNRLPYIWEIVRTSPGLPTLWAGPRFPCSLLRGASISLLIRIPAAYCVVSLN